MAAKNFLSNVEFRMSIKRLPNTTFFLQNANLPGVSASSTEIPTPFKNIYRPETTLTYNELNATFRIDEDLVNYREIYDWIVGTTFPENFEQYKNLKESADGVYSDITLSILNSSKNVNRLVMFKDAFPLSLSDIDFDLTSTDIIYPTATVTFQYNGYTIE